jgi:hypothetical protein
MDDSSELGMSASKDAVRRSGITARQGSWSRFPLVGKLDFVDREAILS